MRLGGKTAIVTGAASGIGFATAALFVAGYWAVTGFNARAGVEMQPLARASLAVPVVILFPSRSWFSRYRRCSRTLEWRLRCQ